MDNAVSQTNCHFTYCNPSESSLQQGDILEKTDDIVKILDEVHPHYTKDDYTNFIVLTQSCDLAKRNNNTCKARYITIAAIRPLRLIVTREIQQLQKTDLERKANICSQEYKFKLKQLLERIFNNNEPEFFYLHEAPDFGLTESSCAFLRLSIAIRSSDHYDTCLRSRILSLTDVFKAKLGWLIGNMYSRVGTEDWVPKYYTKGEFENRIETILNESCYWIEQNKLKEAEKSLPSEILNNEPEDIRNHITNIVMKKRSTEIIDCVADVLKQMNILDEANISKVSYRLLNSPRFKKISKYIDV